MSYYDPKDEQKAQDGLMLLGLAGLTVIVLYIAPMLARLFFALGGNQ